MFVIVEPEDTGDDVNFIVMTCGMTGAAEEIAQPMSFELVIVYPNPFLLTSSRLQPCASASGTSLCSKLQRLLTVV